MLVLIHGTFSDTPGTSGSCGRTIPHACARCSRSTAAVFTVSIIRTLGASPIANALTLARGAPDGARVHLVTHSRGGLVAEVLAHVCANAGKATSTPSPRRIRRRSARAEELAALVHEEEASRRPRRARRVPGAGYAARVEAAGCLPVRLQMDARAGGHSRSRRRWSTFSARWRSAAPIPSAFPACRADSRQPAGAMAARGGPAPIDGQLRVVAGDFAGRFGVSWLKTLLADAFYWTDNDLVVQTRSMYGGGPRADRCELRARRGRQGFALQLLHQRADRRGRRQRAGRRTRREASVRSGRCRGRAPRRPATRRASARRRSSEKPAVFLLPGILGSNLKVGDEAHLGGLAPVNGLERLAYVSGATTWTARRSDRPVYDELARSLGATHEVIPFAFDWRVPIEAGSGASRAAWSTLRSRRKTRTAGAHDRALDGRGARAHDAARRARRRGSA